MKHYVLKVLLGGSGGVGKTTLIHRYLHDTFISDTSMTIGVQFHVQTIHYNDACAVKLALWDLGGQKQFWFMLDNYAEGGRAAYVLFSIADPGTRDDVEKWIHLFKRNMDVNAPVLLVGTKLDRSTTGQKEEARLFANEIIEKHGCIGYVPTSSKTGENVEKAIHALVNVAVPGIVPASCLNTPPG